MPRDNLKLLVKQQLPGKGTSHAYLSCACGCSKPCMIPTVHPLPAPSEHTWAAPAPKQCKCWRYPFTSRLQRFQPRKETTQTTRNNRGTSSVLPGSVLEPGFTTRPRARMISTSNCPFLSIIPTWMSPGGTQGRKTGRRRNVCAKELGFRHFPDVFLSPQTHS